MFAFIYTSFVALSVFAIGQTPLINSVVATIVLFITSLGLEKYVGMGFSGYITDVSYWLTLRGLGYVLKTQLRIFLNWLTFNKVHQFVELVVRSLDIATYLVILSLIWISFSSLLYLLILATSFWAFIISFVLFIPLWIVGFSIVLFGIIDFLNFFLFGIPLGTISYFAGIEKFRKYVKTIYNVAYNFTKTIEKFEDLVILLTSINVYLSVQFLRLPVELISMITVDEDVGQEPRIKYFKTRFCVGFFLAFVHLLNIPGLLVLVFYSLTIDFFVVLVYLMVKFQNEGLISLLSFILLQSFYIIGLIPKSFFFLYTQEVKRVFVLVALRASAGFGRVTALVIPDNDGRPILITVDSDVNLLTETQLNIIISRLCHRDLTMVLPFAGLMLFTAIWYIFVMVKDRVISRILAVPVRIAESIMLFLACFIVPDLFIEILYFGFFNFYKLIRPLLVDLHRYFRMLKISMVYGVLWLETGQDAQSAPVGGADYAKFTRLNGLFVRTWVNMTRRSVIKFIEYLDTMRVPEMAQAAYKPPSLQSLRSTYVFLNEIGFPVDQNFIDSLDRPEASSYLTEWGSWRNWLAGTSDFKLGFHKVAVGVRNLLPHDFFPEVKGYLYTTGFTGVAEEIRSTARYWTGNQSVTLDDEEFDALVDDTWFAVKAQYQDSRLSSFDYIWKNWVKKYNMGFGFGYRTASGKLRQFTRQQVIDLVGGKVAFKKLWYKVFGNFQSLVMPSPVFTKWESLKLKKALSRSVRTVVGSAFVHSVGTYFFNYKPNHNYKPWQTPSKVGMPINGQNFNRLWVSLTGYSKVWAGDMTAFDSSQPPPLLRVCAEIRKRGYTMHQDYHKICEIIDVAYSMLIEQPLAFKNFGDIAFKEQGATTGHTSTTPDNTIMLIANYLFAWRAVTGLRAREFFNFNTLANFGDDHVLAYDPVFGWSPQAAVIAMSKLGTAMRDESPGQSWLPVPGAPLPDGVNDWRDAKFSFLSKMPLPISEVRSELQAAGINLDLAFGTCHDRARLLGKIKAETVERKLATKPKYEAMIGFMELCAHHHDIYRELAKQSITLYSQLVRETVLSGGDRTKIRKPPSYHQVLVKWYAKGVSDPELTPEEEEHAACIMVYDSPDPFGIFVRWLSDFPTLLSPRYRNVRWADWIQNKMVSHLRWPLEYIAASNAIVADHATTRYLAARTPYAFLRSDLLVPSSEPPSYNVLAFRHYLYMLYIRMVNYRRAFNPLDFIRLLDTFFVNALFMLTGRVTQTVVELDLHILDTLVIYLLSYVNIDVFSIFAPFYIPTPSDLIAQLFTYLFTMVTPAGSIDYQSLEARVRLLITDPGYSFVLNAPTGTGKSTRMVNRISQLTGKPLVVIVPRQAVAISVGMFMRKLYPDSGIYIGAEGHKVESDFRIVYTTVQSFFLSPAMRSPNNIFILDEAHINEPTYDVARKFLEPKHLRKIYMTATPGDLFPGVTQVDIPAVNQFKILRSSTSVPNLQDYFNACIAFANDRSEVEKILIFVPTLKQMDYIADRIRTNVCRLSSKHKLIDESASVFLATSVADAGLTIPDVSFVLSPNIDINVSTLETGVVNYYYLLSDLTIKQRAGRTGRTSDGAFLLYKITETPTSELAFSHIDYVTSLAPATELTARYFPNAVKKHLDQDLFVALSYWDVSDASKTWKHFTETVFYTNLESPVKMTRAMWQELFREPRPGVTKYSTDRWDGPKDDSLGPVQNYYGVGPAPEETMVLLDTHTQQGVHFATYQFPNGQKVTLENDNVNIAYTTEKFDSDPPYVAPPLTSDYTVEVQSRSQETQLPVQPVKPPMSWQDVSGRGLRCGIFATIGVIYTVYGIRRSPEYILTQMRGHLDQETVANILAAYPGEYDAFLANEQMFDFQSLQDVMFRDYRIRCSLLWQGRLLDLPVEYNSVNPLAYPEGRLRLEAAHYNYYGLPLDGVPVDDSTPIPFRN